ncbi:SRPBCC family protein [Ramlibacter sp. 2FC]|uniref:SRPBCC family protein n=1 Tax=Ramlibacter sp. 2FC TaxID=2502188 RepID=UPI0010F601CE|nr:SRPBCC family protein [Ramlibacter sp. 2FC]
MKLDNTFVVPADIDTAWRALLDLEAVAPCMPGATLTGFDGDSFTADMKVKLGPVLMTYAGEGAFVRKDDATYTVVIEAKGKEKQGAGGAKALVTVQLLPSGPASTTATLETDLTITGKAAQFGRGLMVDVSKHLVAQFAANLEKVIVARNAAASPAAQGSAAATVAMPELAMAAVAAPRPGAAPAQPSSNEPLDLATIALSPVLKRVGFMSAAVAVLAVAVWWFTR